MARFTGKKAKETPALNMGSMSDIIFMLLFFFMVITTMRESSLYVKIIPPQGSEVTKLAKKSGKFRRKTIDRTEEIFNSLETFINRKAIKSIMK